MKPAPKSLNLAISCGLSRAGLSLLICVICLFAVGLLMVFNATAAEALDKTLPEMTHRALGRQILFAFFSFSAGLGVYWMGYKKLLALSPYLLGATVLFLALVLIPGVGMQINGAKRWIEIAGFSLQPSEFSKIFIPLYFIHVLNTSKGNISLRLFLRTLAVIALPLLLILVEPDNGSVAIIMMTLMALFFITRIRAIYWALPVFIMAVIGGSIAINMPHVRNRIKIYLHPELDLRGKGHQPYQAKIAAGSGRVWGKGPGESLQKQGYLPEARSDYLAAIYAEEFGFMGVVGLIVLLMAITTLGFRCAKLSKDHQGFFVASIMTFLLSFQSFLNLGIVSGLLPSKGTNLPFFSQGGSSLLGAGIALALILSVARVKRHEVEEEN